MDRESFEFEDNEPVPNADDDPVIDFENDQVDVRSDVGADQSAGGPMPEESERRIDNAVLDNTLDEFVDLLNGRDLDGLSDLLAEDAEAAFLSESSAAGVVQGFNDLLLRHPTLLVTRGDIGADPIVAVWIFDREADRFDPFGYITLELTNSGEAMIQRVQFGEELPDQEDVVVEKPDRSELSEWEDWSQLDED